MFSGIITDLGRIRAIKPGGDTCIEVETGYDTRTIAIGASVACAGVCLTVIDKGKGWFAV
ncbi:MAG: riboflavin synthase, partial [Rhodospirillales bacterium]|nr:riboflavin synthase [Rhodospirillales bacterium]